MATNQFTLAERIETVINGPVAEVMLTRADKMNALDLATFNALVEAQTLLAADSRIRAVILHGSGNNFCAGLDMSVLADAQAISNLSARSHGHCNLFQQAALGWRELPVPVISAISGHCLGGGLQIAMATDLRICQPQAKFCVMEIHWGLLPDMGLTITAGRLLRSDVLLELTLTGKTISGEHAVTVGLATHVAENPLASAREIAAQIASKSPDAVRAAKQLFNAEANSIAVQLQAESDAMQALVGSPNQREAVQARLAKRTPYFSDPAPKH